MPACTVRGCSYPFRAVYAWVVVLVCSWVAAMIVSCILKGAHCCAGPGATATAPPTTLPPTAGGLQVGHDQATTYSERQLNRHYQSSNASHRVSECFRDSVDCMCMSGLTQFQPRCALTACLQLPHMLSSADCNIQLLQYIQKLCGAFAVKRAARRSADAWFRSSSRPPGSR